MALLREGVRCYPDDPEIWYQLGDIYVHWGPQLLATAEDAERALTRAVELDPGFAPYRIHLVELEIVRGDSVEAARQLQQEAQLAGPDSRFVQAHRLLYDFTFGPEERWQEIVAGLDLTANPVVRTLRIPVSLEGRAAGRWLALANAACSDLPEAMSSYSPALLYNCYWTLAASGRFERTRQIADFMEAAGYPTMPAIVGTILRQTGMDPAAPVQDPDLLVKAAEGRSGDEGILDPAYFIAGILAVERDRQAVVDSVLDLFGTTADTLA